MKALLIIDPQNDFLPGGNLAVNNGNEIFPFINDIIKNYELVVISQDWHPKEHKSFSSNHKNKNAFDVIDLNGITQVLWPDHCVQDTKGSEFSDDLDIQNIVGNYAIVQKGINVDVDSYSAFFENDHKTPTGLEMLLKDENVDEVDIVGLATDYCVKYTALDSVKVGLKTNVLLKGCRGISEDLTQVYDELKNNSVNLID